MTTSPHHNLSKNEIIVTSVLFSILMFIGIVGNVLVCIIFGLNKHLRSTANYLVINLAIADTLQSFNLVFMILSATTRSWALGDVMCQVVGFTNISFITTSLLSLFLVSLNRYYLVVKNTSKEWFTKYRAGGQIVIVWLLPCTMAIAPVLGWSEYRFRPGKLMCTLSFRSEPSYALAVCFIFLFIPFVIMCVCNWKIFRTLRDSHHRVAVQGRTNARRSKDELKVASMLLVVILFFALFYFPAAILNFVEMGADQDFQLPQRLDLTFTGLAMINHANNPIIYGYMNRNFRKALKNFFKRGKVNTLHSTNLAVFSCENNK